MPVDQSIIEPNRGWAIWKITETEEAMVQLLPEGERIPDNISNAGKRLEWAAGRVLTAGLLDKWNLPYRGIQKDPFGKPSLAGYPFHFSLSHSYPYVAAIIDRHRDVGIDLEQPKEKLFRVANRVLSPSEVTDAGTDMIKHCVYWCAKETLIKIHGKKDLVLAENLSIDRFSLRGEGHINGRIIVNGRERLITLYYRVFDAFVLAFSLPE